MQTRFDDLGVLVPEILLPKQGTDMKKRAVVACDQYTSQKEYWDEVAKFVDGSYSTLNIIYPEVFLEDENDDPDTRITNINATMQSYLDQGVLENIGNAMIYLDRKTSHVASRKGLVMALDLEQYDYSVGSQSLIRATEGTILDRLPPRVKVRKDAPIELPHIMVLIDDPKKTVIEPIAEKVEQLEKVYDTELMMDSGSIKWYKVADETTINEVISGLRVLADKEAFKVKYNVGDDKGVLLFAMGDGNHSLATAKKIWEEKKGNLTAEERENDPARFALIELVNIHDEGLEFEPIHRVLFNVDFAELKADMKVYLENLGCKVDYTDYASLEELKANLPTSDENNHYFYGSDKDGFTLVHLTHLQYNLEVGHLQAFLDEFLKQHSDARIDYVHGEDVTNTLGQKDGNCGFILPIMDKNDFFKTVIVDGALPRKTFSMGEADEKRFYFECRKIK